MVAAGEAGAAMSASLALFEQDPPPVITPYIDPTPGYLHCRRILALRSKEKRREALAAIADPNTRAVVRFYVEDYFSRLHQRPLPCLACIEAEEGITRRFPCRHKLP